VPTIYVISTGLKSRGKLVDDPHFLGRILPSTAYRLDRHLVRRLASLPNNCGVLALKDKEGVSTEYHYSGLLCLPGPAPQDSATQAEFESR
jgi:hypothetical protein